MIIKSVPFHVNCIQRVNLFDILICKNIHLPDILSWFFALCSMLYALCSKLYGLGSWLLALGSWLYIIRSDFKKQRDLTYE